MEQFVELKLIGITYNQIESGVYALILEEPLSKRRLPIVIGYPEAQSIECKIQDVKTPRPLSHDVMASIVRALDAKLTGVYVHRLPSGVFAATIKLINDLGKELNIDSRSSDAIALAIRMDAPIFTTLALLQKSGFDADKQPKEKNGAKARISVPVKPKRSDLGSMSLEDLREKLSQAVADEKYELASKIKKEIERREKPES